MRSFNYDLKPGFCVQGECACQEQDDEEGMEEDEEISEQDEAIFEYAGDVLPSLGQAMTPETFAPYFTGCLPQLLKKMKPHCSIAERSFAVGTMADCVKALPVNRLILNLCRKGIF